MLFTSVFAAVRINLRCFLASAVESTMGTGASSFVLTASAARVDTAIVVSSTAAGAVKQNRKNYTSVAV